MPLATATHTTSRLAACRRCGLVMRVPPTGPATAARCPRCHGVVPDRRRASASPAAAFALAALVLYPLAMTLPVLRVGAMGHTNESTIWSGVVSLFNDGHAVLALIVFVCSMVIPLLKIGGMFAVCAGRRFLSTHHRAWTYRAIDWIGKWGMVDVLLVAVLVAAVKLGDWMDVHAGPGALAFAAVVLLSLLSSAAFDPGAIWEEPE